MNLKWCVCCAFVFALLLFSSADRAWAQNSSYSQGYRKSLTARPTTGLSTDRYLYNKYYRNNPAVSPYVSGAILGGTDSGTAYTSIIRGDVQRRENARRSQMQYVQQRKLKGNVGYTANPGALYQSGPSARGLPSVKPKVAPSSAYHNHWYGAWNR